MSKKILSPATCEVRPVIEFLYAKGSSVPEIRWECCLVRDSN